MSAGFHCNTCHMSFTNIDEVKDHYKTDVHVFNSKRRAKNLAPVSNEDFNRVAENFSKKSTSTTTSSKSIPSPGTSLGINTATNITPKQLQRTFTSSDQARQEKIAAMTPSLHRNQVVADVTKTDSSSSSSSMNVIITDQQHGDNEDEAGEEEEASVAATETTTAITLPISSLIGIFDNKVFPTMEECLSHMVINNGFFVPDSEYIADLEGLLLYLSEKVKVGGTCLYCQRRFQTGRACQDHMLHMSHCKLAYEENVDLEEYEDFYDFSSNYEDMPENDNDDDMSDDESNSPGVAEINSIGEMVLPSGRVLGHRDFRVYYKQHYRPEESRPSVMAQRREELLRIGHKYGDGNQSAEMVERMDDVQIQTALIQHHKTIRKAQIQEQRGMLRQLAMCQQREYKSKIQAARSSATTTKKIRDYHSVIM